MIFSLAYRNVLRNRERSLLTLIGVLLAVGSFVALVSLAEGFQVRVKQELDARKVDLYVLTARGSILPTGPFAGNGFVGQTLAGSWAETIGDLEEVNLARGVVRSAWDAEKNLVPVIGIDTLVLSQFMPGLKPSQGSMMPTEPFEAAVGVSIGEESFDRDPDGYPLVTIEDVPFRVTARVSGGGFRDHFVFVPLSGLLELRPQRGVHEIWIQLHDPNLARGVADKIRGMGIPRSQVLTRKEYLGAAKDYLNLAWLLQAAIAMIGVLIAITASMNTMLMSTYERLKEFATLRAVGASRGVVGKMVLAESIILNLAGGLLGLLFGLAASGVLDKAVRILLEIPYSLAKVTPTLMLQGIGLSLLIGLVGAIIPCWLIFKLDLVKSLRWD